MDVSSTSIGPGKSASLTLQLEPNVNNGVLENSVTISTNDPVRPLQVLKVRAEIQPDIHQISSLEKSKSIFASECRSCHVDKGMDKIGQELYEADCAMCHGSLDERNHVRALSGPRLAEDLQGLRQVISVGTRSGAMPGFSVGAGGPLSDLQIESLVNLFRKWEKTEKEKHSGGR